MFKKKPDFLGRLTYLLKPLQGKNLVDTIQNMFCHIKPNLVNIHFIMYVNYDHRSG